MVFPFALGDCILFLGAIENMQKIYPADEYIRTIACQKGYEDLFKQYFDQVIPVEYTKASVNPIGRIRMIKKCAVHILILYLTRSAVKNVLQTCFQLMLRVGI